MTIDTVPKTVNGSSVHSAAFQLALADLENRQAPVSEATRDELVDAILLLVRAGQRDPERLARYAVSRNMASRRK